MKRFSAGLFSFQAAKFRVLMILALFGLLPSIAQAQPFPYGDFTVDAVEATPWVSAHAGRGPAQSWTITLHQGDCAFGDSGCTPGTNPTACVAQIEGCSERRVEACGADDVIVTNTVFPDCTGDSAELHDELFPHIRVNFTTFTGSGATMRVQFYGSN